jgi:glycosyltransferase involved in cell wall biosynthesis
MRRRVLHFAQDSCTSGFFPQLGKRHDRDRYEMFFGTLNPIAPWLREFMEDNGVRCISLDCRSRSQYPGGMVRLARALRRERIDLLHTHLFEPSVIGLQAGVLAQTPARVMTRHYSDYHTRIDRPLHVKLDQMCIGLSHRVIAVSQHTADHMVDLERARPEKIRVVVNGIDFDRVRVSGDDARDRVRAELGLGDDHVLLIVARLHPEKGYDYLFRALPQIRAQAERPVHLLIAGAGPLEPTYRALADNLGIADAVRFLGFRKDVPDLMAAADLFVLPSLAEAFGLVLTEAIYLGTPVVASRTGGIPEIVDDGVDGVLIPPADTDALARTVVGLLKDPDRRRQLAGAGRTKVVAKFGFDDMVRAYEGVYEELAPGRRRHA